jgi:hypothetical protein
MRPSRESRAVGAALRCYPVRWRSRHGTEAALIASALVEDGVPWWSVALSFLGGATRERVRKPSLRVGTTLAAIAITVAVAAVPLGLLASLTPASASNTNVVIVISKPNDAARQLESAFAAHHFKITVIQKAVPTSLVGSILSVSTTSASGGAVRVVTEERGPCLGGASGCVDGLVLPFHFSGDAHVTIGRAATLESVHSALAPQDRPANLAYASQPRPAD